MICGALGGVERTKDVNPRASAEMLTPGSRRGTATSFAP
jgi:hypothetical protein